MKLKTLAIFAALAGFSGTLLAEAGKPVMVDPEPICDVPFEGTVSFGYESVYLFRGADFGDNAPWAGLDLTGSVAGLEVNVGAWYINTIEDPVAFDELDLYLFVTGPSFGPFDTSIGGTWFYFAEIDDEAGEVEFDISTTVGPLDVALINVYDFTTEGWYWELAAGHSVELTACTTLVLGAGISYGDDYYGVSSFNHAYATAGIDYALTETATFSVYVGGNFPLDDLEDAGEDDDIHGGASISVSF